jgi:uncharacterized membrane protein
MVYLHPRLLGGAALGLLAWGAANWLGLHGVSAGLAAWNIGALGYLGAIWRLYLTADEDDVRTRAANQDESPIVICLLAGLAIVASLTGVFAALSATRDRGATSGAVVTGLSGLTLVSTWFVVQSLFVAHYAHRHFQAVARRGKDAGFLFPGDPPASYLDFAYLAICVGATAQVSDPGVQSRPLRNLVTAHAVTAFFYNTAVLALGVNILSGLLGH